MFSPYNEAKARERAAEQAQREVKKAKQVKEAEETVGNGKLDKTIRKKKKRIAVLQAMETRTEDQEKKLKAELESVEVLLKSKV